MTRRTLSDTPSDNGGQRLGLRPRRPLRTLIAAVEQLNRTAPVHEISCPCDLCRVFLALAYLPPAWRTAA